MADAKTKIARKCGRPQKWTSESILAEARKYSTINEWRTKSSSSYQTACKLGIRSECSSHMAPKNSNRVKWTFDACKKEATKFKSRHEWDRNNRPSYLRALKMGWLDELTQHMEISPCAIKKPVTVFGRGYDTIAQAARYYGLNYSIAGNVNRYTKLYGISLDEACELYILVSHHSQATEINNQMIADAARAAAAQRREENKKPEFSKIGWCRHCGSVCRGLIPQGKDKITYSFCSEICRSAAAVASKRNAMKKERERKRAEGTYDHGKHVKRARRRGSQIEFGITARSVAKRDGFTCQICRRKVVPHKGGFDSRGWSVGHIIAISNGGSHTWDNVQCECHECNSRKGTATYGQIAFNFAA